MRELIVGPGSAVVLSGEARSIWKHGIPARKTDQAAGVRVPRSRRLSITFRTVNLRRVSC
jgi:alkylated DNA repair dioxygenase AlkB